MAPESSTLSSRQTRASSPASTARAPEPIEKGERRQAEGANFSESFGAGTWLPFLLVVLCPPITVLFTFITNDARLNAPTFTGFAEFCFQTGVTQCFQSVLSSGSPLDLKSWCFFAVSCLIARVLYVIPANMKYGPVTGTGHIPAYVDNGMHHCIVSSVIFVAGSNFGLGLWDFGMIYDVFVPLVYVLNLFGLVLCLVLYFKGLHYPSTQDCGSSGSFLADYYWGTELYPKLLGVDVKRFINCRFSMTFWMLSGLSYTYRSYTEHGAIDYGLLLSAVSQYIYLLKFFAWEHGYMCSIDIIVDRAGFYEEWGCLVWVPTIYTLHTRVLVRSPSQLGLIPALVIFTIGVAGLLLNFWADKQREWFRESGGKMKIWGKAPVVVNATYTVTENGKKVTKSSILLASGFWGVARHFHYFFELTAAWSWCLLANPLVNGGLPLFYSSFLTWLLVTRAKRDATKCSLKYGADYKKYEELVPYLILPGIY